MSWYVRSVVRAACCAAACFVLSVFFLSFTATAQQISLRGNPLESMIGTNARHQPGLLERAAQGPFRSAVLVGSDGIRRYQYDYYPSGKQRTLVVQRLKSGAWTDSMRTSWSYDAAGRMLTEYAEHWQQGGFRPLRRSTVVYDTTGDVLSALWEQESGWVLSPSSRMLYAYAAPGKDSICLQQVWSGSWSDQYRWSSTWGSDGRRTSGVDAQWHQGHWDTVQTARFAYDTSDGLKEFVFSVNHPSGDSGYSYTHYDRDGNILATEGKYWFAGVLDWHRRGTASYNSAGRLVQSMNEELVGGTLTPVDRVTCTHDADELETGRLHETFAGGTWHDVSMRTTTFDASGNILASALKIWEGSAWKPADVSAWSHEYFMDLVVVDVAGNYSSFGKFSTISFTYGDVTTTVPGNSTNGPAEYGLMQNYPNPFNAGTVIHYTLPTPEFTTLQVFDLLGREVALLVNEAKAAGEHTARFDAGVLSSGIYVYRLIAGPHVQSSKMILMR